MIFPAEKIAFAFFGGWRMGVFALLACLLFLIQE
jgi:hypothetical protein